MPSEVWYQLAGGGEHTKLYLSLEAAQDGLKRILDEHEAKGHKVNFQRAEGSKQPLFIVEHEGEIIDEISPDRLKRLRRDLNDGFRGKRTFDPSAGGTKDRPAPRRFEIQ